MFGAPGGPEGGAVGAASPEGEGNPAVGGNFASINDLSNTFLTGATP